MRHAVGRRAAFTLVELLVVITIIGILVSMLMPGIQAARELARKIKCKANLRQIGLAALAHVEAQGHYPSSGWGNTWIGDPDRGFGQTQPGGWIYNLLPYLDGATIHDIGARMKPADKKKALGQLQEIPLAVMICPSRRTVTNYPAPQAAMNADQPRTVGKNDYAGNGGTCRILNAAADGCLDKFPNCSWPVGGNYQQAMTYLRTNFNGVTTLLSEIGPAQIKDGVSHTILVGEKYLNPNRYYTGDDHGDNNSLYEGNHWDINRWCSQSQGWVPAQDTPDLDLTSQFGSAHGKACHFVLCDGTVQAISYTVNAGVFERLGNRQDGGSDADPW
jgi:prepilin-type N-terminal cleavage/methylation domain-containing protein